MRILDVNLLLYAVHDGSVHHARARDFLERTINADETVALPWTVILGFLRLVTSPRVFAQPLTPEQAIAIVDGWLARPNVVALDSGPEHWTILRSLILETGTAGNLVTDTHLAALAIERGAVLCSSDSDFARYRALRWIDPIRRPEEPSPPRR